MTPTLVYDVETIPDADGIRLLTDTSNTISDDFVVGEYKEATGKDFLPLHLQKVCAISVAMRSDEGFKIWTIGDAESSEKEMIQRFFDGIDKFAPQIISWNGSGFDLPVLNHRALINGVAATRFWEMGDDISQYRYNNYISRYHQRHLDLMDSLAMYGGRANAPLDVMAKLSGFPGKMGIDGSMVWETYQNGGIEEIRDYCETDVANTHLVYLRFQLLRGYLDEDQYDKEVALVRETIQGYTGDHWKEFLERWPEVTK